MSDFYVRNRTKPSFPLEVKEERQVTSEDETPENSCMDIF